MKRIGYIYEKIYDMDNLRLAHKNARKDKSFYKDVKMVDENPDYYLKQIQNILKDETYEVSKYDISIINDKGKERQLMKLPYFPDRIIQWAILLQIENIFVSTLCYHTCASLKNRGIHRASILTTKYLQDEENTKYCLKIDIRKYYPNVDHIALKQLLRKKFKDQKLLNLFDKIIDSYPGEKGIPIGSYLSQYFANFYLTYFDHWLKEEKKLNYVVRYMDDIIILHKSKAYLHKLKIEMDKYLAQNLRLKIKDNWQVFPSNIRGIDFVGYRHFKNYKLLRKTICKKFKRKMLDIKNKNYINYTNWCSANSYIGWLKWCNSYRLYMKYIIPIKEILTNYYINIISKKGVAVI